jgi:hypothetical protein
MVKSRAVDKRKTASFSGEIRKTAVILSVRFSLQVIPSKPVLNYRDFISCKFLVRTHPDFDACVEVIEWIRKR